jgi:ubiquinol-cytochrome c reductase cytochrome c subunit
MGVLRRILLPFAVLVTAATLGTFVLGRDQVQASSTAMQNPGMRLAASTGITTAGQIAAGRELFLESCSACHGVDGQGSPTGAVLTGPSLRGVGGAAVNLWLTEGWMPLKVSETQPESKPVNFTPQQINDIVAYVVSLAPGGYAVPTSVPLKNASAADGFAMFSLNCAPCHTITGAGDALASGVHAPSLHSATAQQVLEAIRTGPQNMPKFGPNDFSNQQALDVVDYVTKFIKHPTNIGGIGLGGVGPVAEGFVGLFVGVGVCMLAAYWVGDRTSRDEDEHEHGHGDDEQDHDEAGDEGGASAETETETENADA